MREGKGVTVSRHQPLDPPVGNALELTDWQGIEEFIGNQEQGHLRQGRDHVMEYRTCQGGGLCCAQDRRGLNQMQLGSGVKARDAFGGTQSISHQRPATGAQLDQGKL